MKTKKLLMFFAFTCRKCGKKEIRLAKSRPWICAACREKQRIKNSIEQCKFLKEQRRVTKEQLKKTGKTHKEPILTINGKAPNSFIAEMKDVAWSTRIEL